MLQIADYRADGMKLRVRLKCSCGGRRILKVMEAGEVMYQCANCKDQASLRKLKSEATTYWQGRAWEIECEEPKKQVEAVHAHYPAKLFAAADRYAEPYCTLTGHVIEISGTGALFVAQDFKKAYFQSMSTDHRFAVIQWAKLVSGLPKTIRGTIVEIKFREGELPVCHVRVAFQNLSGDEEKLIVTHCEDLRGRVTEWTMG